MMVMAMMMPATPQPNAIHRPPKTIQRMFRNIETGGMAFLRSWSDARRRGRSCRSYDDRPNKQTELRLGQDQNLVLDPHPESNTPLNLSTIRIVFEDGRQGRCGGKSASTGRETMKQLFAAISLAAVVAMPQASRAEDITRFAPLKAEELNPAQKAWADMIAAPPRNAKFTNPPYRAYIRNPDLAPRLTAMSEYVRWNTSLPPRLSELAILIT